MDGFESVEAVAMLAATNRAEILDPALLRPGRFDRRIAVQPPDRVGRRQILELHTRSIPLAARVDLEALAATTPGMVGADLADLANEAALLPARRNHHTVQTADSHRPDAWSVEEDLSQREDLLAKIEVALGGRVADEAAFGTITTGAESDVEQVTTIARQMVGRWGSEAIGFVRVLPADGRGPLLAGAGETSEATQRILDERSAS